MNELDNRVPSGHCRRAFVSASPGWVQKSCPNVVFGVVLAFLVVNSPFPRVAPAFAQTASAPTSASTGDAVLRNELLELLAAGKGDEAVARAETALRQRPGDAGVRTEYVALHVALARERLLRQEYEDCRTFLEAALNVSPRDADALQLREILAKARTRAAQAGHNVDRYLRCELFEPALDEIAQAERIRPELAPALRDAKLAAWLGAADDQFLARNFPEALALYEKRLRSGVATEDVRSRWGISLILALAEQSNPSAMEIETATRLRTRATDVIFDARLRAIASGLLLERAGQLVDAGREFAGVLGRPFELPPVEQRKAIVARMREEALAIARDAYQHSPTRRRAGAWATSAPADMFKTKRMPHVSVVAGDEALAQRVGEAAEFHLAGLADWLGVALPADSPPRIEIDLHADSAALTAATGAAAGSLTVSQTRQQGERVLGRTIHVTQSDPWLLSATLPRELTLALLDGVEPALPAAVAEGLALTAECGARRLMYRRTAPGVASGVNELLVLSATDAGAASPAMLHALAEFLLATARSAASQPAAALVHTMQGGADWRRQMGWESVRTMETQWRAWYDANRAPPRMPLMVMDEK